MFIKKMLNCSKYSVVVVFKINWVFLIIENAI